MCVLKRSVSNMNEDIRRFVIPAQVKRCLKSIGGVGIDEGIAALIESGNNRKNGLHHDSLHERSDRQLLARLSNRTGEPPFFRPASKRIPSRFFFHTRSKE